MTNNGVTVAVAALTRTLVPQEEKPDKFTEDDLYIVYCAITTSKELWDSLEKKYKIEDACLKKFVVSMFLDYKMVDSKTVGSQVQKLQLILHDLIAEDMVINESFQVGAMIAMLPPSWNNIKNYLKHKCKEMKLEDLLIRLKIEEDNKIAKKKSRKSSTIIAVNIVEEAPTIDKKRKKSNGQKSEQAKKKFKGNCYNYGKAGHRSSNCHAPKEQKQRQRKKSSKHRGNDGRCR
ncbi:hypothetical protein EJD97_015119 [Solanum chilense]|uniref:CCHC-type domain-containing protein n=1 Tax=Solanum chilense TaxID=4083 RepID=A0A6N2B7I8_SOLCI|nr:hypothetical protein EJD97_015119 [Solanum chilense]